MKIDNIRKQFKNLPILAKIALFGAFFAFLFFAFQLAHFLFERNQLKQAWKLVPETAVLALEVRKIPDFWQEVDSSTLWKTLREVPYFHTLNHRAKWADSLSRRGWEIESFLNKQNLITSLHITPNRNLDWVFYLPLEGAENLFIQNFVEKIQSQKGYSAETHEFQGFRIQEIVTPDKQIFAYLFHQNFFIGSFTPLLIEDVIRNIRQTNRQSFYQTNDALFELDKKKGKYGNLYLNMYKIADLISLASVDSCQKMLPEMPYFSAAFLSNFEWQGRSLSLSGLNAATENMPKNDYLKLFEDQKPTQIQDLVHFVPQRTALFYRMGFDDPKKLYQDLLERQKQTNPNFGTELENMNRDYGLNLQDFYEELDGEVGLAILETPERPTPDKLIFAKLNASSSANALLQKLARNSAKDTLGIEEYADLKITRLEIANFPSYAFGEIFSGFRNTYFTIINNYLILANHEKGIRDLINDIDNQEVWTKLPKQKQWIGNWKQKNNLQLVMDLPKIWNLILPNLKPEWRGFFEKNKRQFLRFEYLNYETRQQDGLFYTNFQIFHKFLPKTQAGGFEKIYSTTLNAAVAGMPQIVQNNADQSLEILVRDARNNLYLLDKNGKKRWNTALEGSVISPIYQVDMLKNGKLQYAFASTEKIYVIDRLGRKVGNFPISPSAESRLEHFTVLDYDKSKNYRFVAVEQSGNVYFFSKNASILEGWKPRKFLGALADAVGHVRSKQLDYMIAVQKDGMVNVVTRNALIVNGFPLRFETNVEQPIFIQYGADAEETLVEMMSETGELIGFNLLGKVVRRDPLLRPENTSIFSFCISPNQKDWVAARQDSQLMTVYDRAGNALFEKEITEKGRILVQYFYFTPDIQVLSLTNWETKKVNFYYRNGDPLLAQSLDNDQALSMRYDELQEAFFVYKSYKNKIEMVKILKN